MNRELKITGKGKISITPDLVILDFPITSSHLEYGETIEKLNQKVDALRSILTDQEIPEKDLKTINFSINRNSEWDKSREKRVFIGYTASHNLNVEIPFNNDLLNNVITALCDKVKDIEFRISFGSKTNESHKAELIKNAIEDAKNYAKIIADASNVSLKEIVQIDFTFKPMTLRSTPMHADVSLTKSARSMPNLNPDDLSLEKSIHITWAIE